MSDFTKAFREVSAEAAASALLYSEELQGSSEFAEQLDRAAKNLFADSQMLASWIQPFVSEDEALDYLTLQARKKLSNNPDMLPDEAIIEVVKFHQERLYPTREDAQARVDMFDSARRLTINITHQFDRIPAHR